MGMVFLINWDIFVIKIIILFVIKNISKYITFFDNGVLNHMLKKHGY